MGTGGLADPVFIAGKAALSALLAWAGVRALGVPDALSATFVSVVCVSPTVYSGVRRGLDQLAASVIGGAVVWLLAWFLPVPLVIALGMLVTVWATFRLGFARGYVVAAFTVLYMVLLPKGGAEQTFLVRLSSVGIGVVCALVVNLAVSLPLWRSVFERRLRIARQNVARHFERLAQAMRQPTDLSSSFDDAFPLLRELSGELSDALRESRLRGGRTQHRLEEAVKAAEALEDAAHYGKDLVLRLDRQAPSAVVADAVERLAISMRDDTDLPPEAGALDPTWSGPLQSASAAWRGARGAMNAFSAGVPAHR